MFYRKLSILSVAMLIISMSYSFSQPIKKVKFGKISMEEMTMQTYSLDTTAEAVLLYQIAEFLPNNFQFRQHQRIKILKKSGTGYANIAFPGQLKSQIKGYTYNLEDGKIVKTKLSKEAVFEERVVGNIYRTRIAMPNVKEGSVIEVEFTKQGIANSIEIQRTIPVMYSVVSLPQHPNIDFSIKVIGLLGPSYNQDDTWVFKDLPAFVREPYLLSDMDYRVRFEIEIRTIQLANQYYQLFSTFASSWKAVTKSFNDDPYFGKKINYLSLYLNSLADSIKSISSNDEEILRNGYEAIKQIKWNGQEACYVSNDCKQAYQQKSGNSAEINLNLLVLLKKLGFNVFPVLTSTRSNGKISRFTPTKVKFNYVVVGVERPSGTLYLDATEEYAPVGLVPTRLLSCNGHPLDETKGECSVTFNPVQKDKKTTNSKLSIDDQGKVNGEIEIIRYDYNAIDFKNALKKETDHEAYIQGLESENQGWYVDDFTFTNLNDNYQPFKSDYKVSLSSTSGQTGILALNPFAFVKLSGNPFPRDTRSAPISFPCEIDHSSTVSITIPEGYAIEEMPKSDEIANRDNTVTYKYTIRKSGNTITINTRFIISKLEFNAWEYNSMRSVFEKMIQKQGESLILKKI